MGRRCLGLPSEWSEVQKWLEEGDDIDPPTIADQPKFQKIWERVPTLLDYCRSQGQEFWENFPTQPLPTAVYSSVMLTDWKNYAVRGRVCSRGTRSDAPTIVP